MSVDSIQQAAHTKLSWKWISETKFWPVTIITGYLCFCRKFGFWQFLSSDMDEGPNSEESVPWDELYKIDLVPSELFIKFRKEVQGIRVGANMEVRDK